MNYIKKLSILNESTNQYINLQFKEGTNIIIGPKGGGKSTLLSLIYALHTKTKIQSWIKNALASCDLKTDTAILEYSDNQKVITKQLSSASDYSDIITQSDDIKTRIDNDKQIKEDKNEFQRSLISQQAKLLVDAFKQYFMTFEEIHKIKGEDVQWWLLEKITNKNKDLLANIIKQLSNECDLFSKSNQELIKHSAKSIALLQNYQYINNHFEDSLFIKEDIKFVDEFIVRIDHLIAIHKKQAYIEINKYVQTTAIEKTLKHLKRIINERTAIISKIETFRMTSENFFKNLAKQIAINVAMFESIVTKRLHFDFVGSRKTKYDIELSINQKITIEPNDVSVLGILSHTLHKANKDETRYSNWLYKSIESETPVKDSNFDKHVFGFLGEKVSQYIKLLADGIDYQIMSLGTKTSFGLRKKISNHQSSYIFLDQPEDNIDSNTIYSTLIPLIEKSMSDGQIFMVTHNANFGIIMDTKTVTVANLDNRDEPYIQTFDVTTQKLLKDMKTKDSPVALYLEGGIQSIIDRHKKLTHNK